MKLKRIIIGIFSVLTVISTTSHASDSEKYVFDTSHTLIQFSVRHFGLSKVNGQFTDFSGFIKFNETDITKSSVEITINVNSITTDEVKRDAHLKSADFFDAKKYPHITFKSKKIEKQGDKYIMTGDFTMKGVTKEIEIPFEFLGKVNAMGRERIGAEAGLSIDRQDYGVSWSRTLDTGGLVVANTVKIELSIEAVKQK